MSLLGSIPCTYMDICIYRPQHQVCNNKAGKNKLNSIKLGTYY